MKHLWYVFLSPLLAVSACGQFSSQDKRPISSVKVAGMVDRLYKEVVVRHPLGTPDRKVFGPYLSKGLLHSFDLDDACFDRWRRANPDPNLKPDVGLLEFRVFSGGAEDTIPQAFQIEKVETEKGGSYRVHVKLTQSWTDNKMIWYVVAVVIVENGRPVVNDVIYLKHADFDEEILSNILIGDCKVQ